MTMNIQRIRNLTTSKLHTEMAHIYEDLAIITGQAGLMTHMLPGVRNAVEPWLRDKLPEPRFWDGQFDQSHTGEIELPTPTEDERKAMFERYAAQPNLLAGKTVIGVQV